MTMTVYDYVALKRYIASLFDGRVDGRVDVVDREASIRYLRPRAGSDAVYAF